MPAKQKLTSKELLIKQIKEQQNKIKIVNENAKRMMEEEEERNKELDLLDKQAVKEDKEDKKMQKERDKKRRQEQKDKENEENRLRIINQLNNQVSINKNIKQDQIHNNNQNIQETIELNNKGIIQSDIRMPICCIFGHIDAGKTSLLDRIRGVETQSVQINEVAGITQQMGVTLFTRDRLNECINTGDIKYKGIYGYEDEIFNNIGLLMIDTPGHESFINIRKQSGMVADIAIIVVDILHGIEKQTIESIKYMQSINTKFMVVLNKIDRIDGWQKNDGMDFMTSYNKQTLATKMIFDTLLSEIMLKLSELGVNSDLFYKNINFEEYIPLVPISSYNKNTYGECINDLIYMILYMSYVLMRKQLIKKDIFEAYILEVNSDINYGLTVSILLVNGELNIGDNLLIMDIFGSFITITVNKIYISLNNVEQRNTKNYIHKKNVKATCVVRISGNNLNNVIPGTSIKLLNNESNIEDIKKEYNKDIRDETEDIKLTNIGISIQCSTYGSLNALYNELKKNKIQICNIGIGDVKIDNLLKVKKATEYCQKNNILLVFDVNVNIQMHEYAKTNNIIIIEGETIYRLIEKYIKWLLGKKEEMKQYIIEPVKMQLINTFLTKDNYVIMGCKILEGRLKIGTPIYYINKIGEVKEFGKILCMQINNKDIQIGEIGEEVGIKISNENNLQINRHYEKGSILKSKITKESVNTMMLYFEDDLTDNIMCMINEYRKELLF